MKSRMEKVWTIKPSDTPLYIRRCSKCKRKMPYYCSNKFRINANKRTVDIWLIFKCTKCDNTSNIDIYSRVAPKSIDEQEYYNFQCNDEETAWKYAFDPNIINQNKVEVDFSQIEYILGGDILTLKEISELVVDLIEFEIQLDYSLDIDLSNLIRKNLDISLSQLEDMLSSGIITIFPAGPVRKTKVKSGQKIIIHREKLVNYLNKNNS